jgi:hypothetical protein
VQHRARSIMIGPLLRGPESAAALGADGHRVFNHRDGAVTEALARPRRARRLEGPRRI